MPRKWTEKQRKIQAARIRRHQPWKKSTGPRTREGKERSKMNAFIHGNDTPEMKIVAQGLWHQQQFLKNALAFYMAEQRLNDLRERTDNNQKENNEESTP